MTRGVNHRVLSGAIVRGGDIRGFGVVLIRQGSNDLKGQSIWVVKFYAERLEGIFIMSMTRVEPRWERAARCDGKFGEGMVFAQ